MKMRKDTSPLTNDKTKDNNNEDKKKGIILKILREREKLISIGIDNAQKYARKADGK